MVRKAIAFIGVAAALLMTIVGALAHDESKYPNLKGQWDPKVFPGVRGQPSFDQTRGWGELQGALLIPEYQKIFEENTKDPEGGGHFPPEARIRPVTAGRFSRFSTSRSFSWSTPANS